MIAREIQGIVGDGQGKGGFFTQLDWVRRQFRDQLGFDPYPGTLNLRVSDTAKLAAWRTRRGILIEPNSAEDCAAQCYRVEIQTRAAVWIVPAVPGYPDDLIELIAPVALRAALGLKNGDTAEVRLVE
jgi:riboflavin kinase